MDCVRRCTVALDIRLRVIRFEAAGLNRADPIGPRVVSDGMKIQQLLAHHGIKGDPFGEEDAQTDAVFKRACLKSIHHPAWSKFFGSPSEPSTAIVFGEKGSGKTAMKLQTFAEIEEFNRENPTDRVFIIAYDDFNPSLDHVKTALGSNDAIDVLKRFRLQDHIDALLSLGVTKFIDQLKLERADLAAVALDARRDLLLLAALYDQSTAEPIHRRWTWLRRRSRSRPPWQRRDLLLGIVGSIAAGLLLASQRHALQAWAGYAALAVAAGWSLWAWRLLRSELRARDLRAALRVLKRDPAALRSALMWFDQGELAGMPLPGARQATGEERYELLRKFQGVLAAFGYRGIVVLIDRVDEPQLIEGDPRKMRALVWPLLEHKFLRHPGLGVKMLLPIELAYYLEKEDKEFYDRARPDKLNMIKPLRWSGPSLYDLATDRLRACAAGQPEGGPAPRLRLLIDEAVSDDALKDALSHLRTPRQLFKFLHRLLQEHCHKFTEDDPRWTIDADTFRMVYASHLKELDAFDRGFGHG